MLLDTNQLQQAKQIVEKHFGRKILSLDVIHLHGDDQDVVKHNILTNNLTNKAFFGTLQYAPDANEEIGQLDEAGDYEKTLDLSYYTGIPGQAMTLYNLLFQTLPDSVLFNAFSFVGYEFILEAI